MGKHPSGSPKSVREQIQDSAKDLWSSVMTLDVKRSGHSRDTSSNDQQESQQMSLESVIRVMFGSCTAGLNPATDEPPTVKIEGRKDSSLGKDKSRLHPLPSSPTDPDVRYRNIFADDSRVRAEEAVTHLREHQMDHQKPSKSSGQPKSGKDLPGMFPVSSPQRHIAVPSSSRDPPATIQQQEADYLHDVSFDDGISIITQHTLDEVAREYGGVGISRVHSDITQDPIEEIEESWKQSMTPRAAITRSPPTRPSSPQRLGPERTRSQCTTHTKRSVGTKSMGTKSSMSTQTNEFASVWQREEQKYWDDVVRGQEGESATASEQMSMTMRHQKLARAKEISRKARLNSSDRSEQNSKRDGTITTVHSTVFSSRSGHLDRSFSATQRDPDRFLDVLIMPPGTEMGEI